MRVCGNGSERVDVCVDVCEWLECAGESRIQLVATHMRRSPLSPPGSPMVAWLGRPRG